MYLSYFEYQNYGGMLENTAFNRLNLRAEKILDTFTFDRLKEKAPDENTKLCMFELIENLSKLDNGRAIKSVSNDGVSISYEDKSNFDVLKQIVYDFFADTDLMSQ